MFTFYYIFIQFHSLIIIPETRVGAENVVSINSPENGKWRYFSTFHRPCRKERGNKSFYEWRSNPRSSYLQSQSLYLCSVLIIIWRKKIYTGISAYPAIAIDIDIQAAIYASKKITSRCIPHIGGSWRVLAWECRVKTLRFPHTQ